MGMGSPGPIPWTAIDAWARRHGVEDEEAFEDLVVFVQAQDRVYLEHCQDQQKRSQRDHSSADGMEAF